jgi:peptide/nickel transport system substrate-binding protein
MYAHRRRRLILIGIAGVIVVAAIVAIVAGSSGSGDSSNSAPGASHVLRIAIPGDIETLDSDFSHYQLSNEVHYNTQDQFFRYGVRTVDGVQVYDPTKIEGSAIESWKVAPDGKSVELKLRPGQKFDHTGNPVTADDLVYWYKRALGTKSGYLFNVNAAGITGVEKTGPESVRVEFKQRSPFFFQLFRDQSQAPVDSKEMDKHATDADPWATKWKSTHEAADGEYYVESSMPGVETVLRANPDYWAGKPYYDQVVLKVTPSAANRALLLQRGAVDIAEGLGIDQLDDLRDADGVKVLSVPDRNQYHLGFNNKRKPFDDVDVRRALSYAVPYDSIVKDVLRGQAQTPRSPIAQAGQGFDGSAWPYSYDLDKARSMLADAGYPDGFAFTLAIGSDDPAVEEMAIVLKDQFKRVGVEMKIDKQTNATFAETLDKRRADAWMRSVLWYIDDPGYVGQTFYQCGGLLNWTDYCDKQVDAVVKQLVDAPQEDTARRQRLADEMQKRIIDAAPSLILAEPNYQLAMRDDITGYQKLPDDLLWYYPLKQAG